MTVRRTPATSTARAGWPRPRTRRSARVSPGTWGEPSSSGAGRRPARLRNITSSQAEQPRCPDSATAPPTRRVRARLSPRIRGVAWPRSSSSSPRSGRSRGPWARSACATRSTRCSRWSATCSRSPRCSCCCGRSSSPPPRSIVYAGAVMVLYVFVVAYVGEATELPPRRQRRARACAPCRAAVRGRAARRAVHRDPRLGHRAARRGGQRLVRPASARRSRSAQLFLTKFLLAFELASLLLLIAAVGAVILARRRGGLEPGPRGHLGRRRAPRARADGELPEGEHGDDGRGRRHAARCR